MFAEQKTLIDLVNGRFENATLSGLTPENWSRVVSEACRHRIAPLLYHKLRLAGAELMFPEDVLQKLRATYLATASRNTVLYHQLNKLIVCLNANDIPVLLLKGAHLAEFVYEEIALRPMSDLDILVKEEHVAQVVQIAFDAGYRFYYDIENATEKTGETYCYEILRYYKHFQPLVHTETKCMLEIHCFLTEVGGPFQISIDDIWRTASPETLDHNNVLILSPENLIIHLCIHAAYDHLFGFGMSMLYDIKLSIQKYAGNIDWEDLMSRSRQWGVDRCLNLALYFSEKYFSAGIPSGMYENMPSYQMADLAEERLFASAGSARLHPHFIMWRNRKSVGERIHYVFEVLFPGREFMANRYIKPKGTRFLFFSYFYRLFQVMKGLWDILKTVISDRSFVSHRKYGDDDFRLREWLATSLESKTALPKKGGKDDFLFL